MLDRGILVIILGQYTNYLITTGKISANCQNDVTTAVQILAVAAITLGTGAIGILHKPAQGQRNILQVVKDLLWTSPTSPTVVITQTDPNGSTVLPNGSTGETTTNPAQP